MLYENESKKQLKLKDNNNENNNNKNNNNNHKSSKKNKYKMPELKEKYNNNNGMDFIKARNIGKRSSNFSFQSSNSYNKSLIFDNNQRLNQTNDVFNIRKDKLDNYNFNFNNNIIDKKNTSSAKPKAKLKKSIPIIDYRKENEKNKEKKKLKLPMINNNNNNNNNNADFPRRLSSNNSENNSKIINSEIGFTNLGNTCFMNTCLQNLIHSEYFIKILFSKINLVSKKTPITYYFIKLCLELIDNKGIKVISPKNIKEVFSSLHHEFRGYRQHDAQEFCRIFLEDINQELNEIKIKPPYKELSTTNKTKIECDKEFDDNFKSRENSIITQCFYSQIINIFTCKCGFETYSFQKVLDFPLLLKKDCKKIELDSLLKAYFESEKIPFETKCEKCKKKQIHKKEIKFSQTPNILILSLQRRNERTGKKNECSLKFPEFLNIIDYIDKDFIDKNESKYMLYGIGNHIGDFNFGHYFAYIKLNKEQWYEFNDSTVVPYSNLIEKSSSAYILFYQKIK
jgi:ubiquitin C-terminal hydrolase